MALDSEPPKHMHICCWCEVERSHGTNCLLDVRDLKVLVEIARMNGDPVWVSSKPTAMEEISLSTRPFVSNLVPVEITVTLKRNFRQPGLTTKSIDCPLPTL